MGPLDCPPVSAAIDSNSSPLLPLWLSKLLVPVPPAPPELLLLLLLFRCVDLARFSAASFSLLALSTSSTSTALNS